MLTWVEINAGAIKNNLKQYRRLTGGGVLLMPVIKANGYGHGFAQVAKICGQSWEADRICVVNLDEALELIKLKIKKPAVILSFFDADLKKISFAARHQAAFPLYSLNQAKILHKAGERIGKKIRVHLKIDTGAARVGLQPEEAADFAKTVEKKYKWLEIEGVFSHFASSEENYSYTKYQHQLFQSVCLALEKEGIKPAVRHIACSAAMVAYPQAKENAVRLGLGLYGLYSSAEARRAVVLKPALTWKTTVIQVKEVAAGAKVGYGGTHTTARRTKIAVLPVGYWDGYDRRLSNNANVIINGVKCPVIGRICMNMCMADATGTDAREGDLAVLLGRQGRAEITADELAEKCGTINYEIADRINPLLPRIVK